MRRNILLVIGAIVALMLIANSAKRLMSFRTTSRKVEEAQVQLDKLKAENTNLQKQLDYTKSGEFKEREIRDKLGLTKPGETVVILPKENRDQLPETSDLAIVPNYIKWWNRFFAS
ncbi:MAG TPA: septum formation initiator family protein [Candidatus Saccharimonadales bacterium]|nr:septum formation initiator family protein [Candidatus Saccharimonadales bacterium]